MCTSFAAVPGLCGLDDRLRPLRANPQTEARHRLIEIQASPPAVGNTVSDVISITVSGGQLSTSGSWP